MFKKLTAMFLAILLLCAINVYNKTPVFSEYTDEFEVYINESTSCATILNVTKEHFPFVKNVCGEAIKIELDEFSLDEFLKDFSAKKVFSEIIPEGISYYAFSPKIKYRKEIRGKTVNLHIFIGKSVTVGAPIICGSF